MRIKCPHCNGKGFSEINSALNLTCGWCMGQGELDLEIIPTEQRTEAELEKKWENTVWDTDVYLDDIDGKEPMTNEEWLRQASTEELADVLTEIACESYYDGLDEKLPLKHNCKHFMKWLKEKHE